MNLIECSVTGPVDRDIDNIKWEKEQRINSTGAKTIFAASYIHIISNNVQGRTKNTVSTNDSAVSRRPQRETTVFVCQPIFGMSRPQCVEMGA